MKRVDRPNDECPCCHKKNALWITYRLIPDAPAAGCGTCGHVVYLTKRPPHSAFYVNADTIRAA